MEYEFRSGWGWGDDVDPHSSPVVQFVFGCLIDNTFSKLKAKP
jgi:hypothetical protein